MKPFFVRAELRAQITHLCADPLKNGFLIPTLDDISDPISLYGVFGAHTRVVIAGVPIGC